MHIFQSIFDISVIHVFNQNCFFNIHCLKDVGLSEFVENHSLSFGRRVNSFFLLVTKFYVSLEIIDEILVKYFSLISGLSKECTLRGSVDCKCYHCIKAGRFASIFEGMWTQRRSSPQPNGSEGLLDNVLSSNDRLLL